MAVPQERLYTVQEFEQMVARPENQGRLFELIDREIVERCRPRSTAKSR
jgi:hypothetical protein